MAKPKPRPEIPHRMRLTDRDKALLQFIADFEGLVSRRQLARVFFGGNDDAAKKRLRLLFENGYVLQPTENDMHRVPRGEWIYWLDTIGIETVAGLRGEEPRQSDRARTQAPQWAKCEHDLALNDFRLAVGAAIACNPTLTLADWINEKTLTHWGDTIIWTQPNGRRAKKKFAMDGFFLVRRQKEGTDKRETFAYLVEIDRGTHVLPAFQEEKIRPGVVYISSSIYEARFGVKHGRFLVITTGGERMEHLIRQAGRVEGGEVFYFTRFADISPETLFTAPIWRSSGKDKPFALIPLQPTSHQ